MQLMIQSRNRHSGNLYYIFSNQRSNANLCDLRRHSQDEQRTDIRMAPVSRNCTCSTQNESNDLVTYLTHLINNKKSTGANICCEKRMKCCRPKVDELVHNLMRSLLWSSESNKLSHLENEYEKVRQLSQKLFDENIIEWFVCKLNLNAPKNRTNFFDFQVETDARLWLRSKFRPKA